MQIHGRQNRNIGSTLRPKYIPHSYMGPLGKYVFFNVLGASSISGLCKARLILIRRNAGLELCTLRVQVPNYKASTQNHNTDS